MQYISKAQLRVSNESNQCTSFSEDTFLPGNPRGDDDAIALQHGQPQQGLRGNARKVRHARRWFAFDVTSTTIKVVSVVRLATVHDLVDCWPNVTQWFGMFGTCLAKAGATVTVA